MATSAGFSFSLCLPTLLHTGEGSVQPIIRDLQWFLVMKLYRNAMGELCRLYNTRELWMTKESCSISLCFFMFSQLGNWMNLSIVYEDTGTVHMNDDAKYSLCTGLLLRLPRYKQRGPILFTTWLWRVGKVETSNTMTGSWWLYIWLLTRSIVRKTFWCHGCYSKQWFPFEKRHTLTDYYFQ